MLVDVDGDGDVDSVQVVTLKDADDEGEGVMGGGFVLQRVGPIGDVLSQTGVLEAASAVTASLGSALAHTGGKLW